jgi:glycosyltransferase involved in cell wall biosynthesis
VTGRVCIYYRRPPERDRWLPADRFIRPWLRQLISGKPPPGGLDKVFANLCRGLDRLGIPYHVNLPFDELRPDDRVSVLGLGRHALDGYKRTNRIVAGIGLMTHPSEWPSLCEDYPVAFYLQHSEWANNVYKPFFGDRCRIWPVGIDTDAWRPADQARKSIDFLIYDKILWDRDCQVPRLLDAVHNALASRSLTYMDLRYGAYREREYKDALDKCRAMVFLCEHESQGIAYLECLASGVPILAWDQGRYLDPNRFAWGQPEISATSVPYFDERCGLRFRDIDEFPEKLAQFLDLDRSGAFNPRAFVIDTLTLERCSARFLELLDLAQTTEASSLHMAQPRRAVASAPAQRGGGPA